MIFITVPTVPYREYAVLHITNTNELMHSASKCTVQVNAQDKYMRSRPTSKCAVRNTWHCTVPVDTQYNMWYAVTICGTAVQNKWYCAVLVNILATKFVMLCSTSTRAILYFTVHVHNALYVWNSRLQSAWHCAVEIKWQSKMCSHNAEQFMPIAEYKNILYTPQGKFKYCTRYSILCSTNATGTALLCTACGISPVRAVHYTQTNPAKLAY